VIFVSDCYVVNNNTPTSTTYPFILLNKGNLIVSGVFVSGISFSGKDHLAVINVNGDASISLLNCSFDNVTSGGISGSLITDLAQVSSKLLVILINNSLIHNVKTTEAINGAAFTFSGGSSSNIIVHNSKFENITGKSDSSVGGAIYVNIAMFVEIDGSSFNRISDIYSGGAVYITKATVLILNNLFVDLKVSRYGGYYIYVCASVIFIFRRFIFW
jgi:hypothetical protein